MITLFVMALLAPWVVSWFLRPRYLFWVMTIFYFCFGGMELYSKIHSGVSISGHIWVNNYTNPDLVTVFCVTFVGMAVALWIHFKTRKTQP